MRSSGWMVRLGPFPPRAADAVGARAPSVWAERSLPFLAQPCETVSLFSAQVALPSGPVVQPCARCAFSASRSFWTRLFASVEMSAVARQISSSFGATSPASPSRPRRVGGSCARPFARPFACVPSLCVLPSPESFQPRPPSPKKGRGILDSLPINSLHSNAYRTITGRSITPSRR